MQYPGPALYLDHLSPYFLSPKLSMFTEMFVLVQSEFCGNTYACLFCNYGMTIVSHHNTARKSTYTHMCRAAVPSIGYT